MHHADFLCLRGMVSAQCVQSGGDDRRRRRTYPWTIKALFLRSPQDAAEAADGFSGNCQLR